MARPGPPTAPAADRVLLRRNAVLGGLRIMATLSVVLLALPVLALVLADGGAPDGGGGSLGGVVLPVLNAGVLVWLYVRVRRARVEVGPHDLLVVNPFRTVSVPRHEVVRVRPRGLLFAVTLGVDLRDGSSLHLVGVSAWVRRGMLRSPAWFESAGAALDAWMRHGTRPDPL